MAIAAGSGLLWLFHHEPDAKFPSGRWLADGFALGLILMGIATLTQAALGARRFRKSLANRVVLAVGFTFLCALLVFWMISPLPSKGGTIPRR